MKGVPGPETRLLVVEDNRALRVGMARALAERFDVVDVEDRGDAALARLRDAGIEPYDVIVTDLRMPGADGQTVLRAAQQKSTRTAVILVTAFATIDAAVAAMKHGAFDFVEKPFPLDELDARVVKALGHARLVGEVTTLRASLSAGRKAEQIVGRSAALATAVELAQRVAPMRSTVLLTGETGTGKELVAGLIHEAGTRAGGPFVKVNCAALPETLLESELFGHEKGAFTSADRVRIGRFEQANGGTLFLDEIGDLSLATQAKLLRALQDQEFQRLGGTRVLRTDARIIAATNRDLERGIASGDFREDLYFRLNVITIALPPLRERHEDIESLALHFLEHFGQELGRPRQGFAPEARSRLLAHPWPGNVRELRNAIERAVLLSEGARIEAADLRFSSASHSLGGDWRPSLPAAGVALDEIERAVVVEALERHGFVQKDAAAWLRISRRKLNYMVQKMRLTHPSWRRNRDDAGDEGA
jgi:DNA-binding NtrC family response regulator